MIEGRIFVTAFIADIHFGAVKSDILFTQLEQKFLKIIRKNKLDMIVFGGDLFHSIITMNYSTSHYVLLFMDRVMEICKKNKIKYVRILQGTMSHDNNQLNNFKIYENNRSVDFKVIPTVQEETLSEGVHILYVPEEYMENREEYYSRFLNRFKDYDFIFGHGMFTEVSFQAKKQDSEVTMSKAPIFNSKTFINACRGPIYFGHIHMKTTIKDHIYYPGSFSRWRFGEEDPKGWYLCMYDINTHKYLHEFIENKLAEQYLTIETIPTPEMTPDMVSTLVTNALKEAEHVKLKIIIRDNCDCSYLLSYLNNMYSQVPDVKLDVINEYEFKTERLIDTKIKEIMSDYDFIKDPGLTHEEKIQRYIKIKRGKVVPISVITDILNIK